MERAMSMCVGLPFSCDLRGSLSYVALKELGQSKVVLDDGREGEAEESKASSSVMCASGSGSESEVCESSRVVSCNEGEDGLIFEVEPGLEPGLPVERRACARPRNQEASATV